MGGRGAASGTKYYYDGKVWRKYGDEFETVHTSRNIKFLINKIGSNTKAPKETRTQGRIYVTVNKKENVPQYITYYDKNGKKFKQIDVNQHNSHKIKTKKGVITLDAKHRHLGYEHAERGSSNLYQRERKIVATVLLEWRKFQRSKK